MEKIHKDSIMLREEFQFGNAYLKNKIEKVSEKFQTDSESIEEKARVHFKMVAALAKLFLTILASFTEESIKKINHTKGNLYILNRYLALRQLCETQLKGLMQGTWGIPPTIVNSDDFKKAISFSDISISSEDIYTELINIE